MTDETTSTLETGVDTEPVRVETVKEEVDAQVVQPREPDADKVQVHEVKVATDVVITDPSSPLAVQTEGGEGSLDLPIHKLDAPSAEQVLAGDADPAEGQQTEPTPNVDVPAEPSNGGVTTANPAETQPSDS